jgi:hypothetical protein
MATMRPSATGGPRHVGHLPGPVTTTVTSILVAVGVAVLVVVTAALGALARVGPASAAASVAEVAGEPAECNALVLDPGHHVDAAKVTKAARRVQDQAADIRVRVLDSVPDGNLDAYVRSMTKRCGTWQGAHGGVKNNLVVMALDVGDRRTGLYYGDTFDSILDHEWTGIQAEAMNPRFKAGDFTGGLVAGLTRVAHFVDPTYDPTPARDQNGGSPQGNGGPGSGPITFADSPGSTGGATSGGGVVLLVLLLIGALAGAVFGAVFGRRRHLAKVAARANAATARGEMTDAFVALDESSELAAARVQALPAVTDSLVQAARDLGHQATAAAGAATAEYLTVEEANRETAIAAMKTAQAAAAAQTMIAVHDQLIAAAKAWEAATAKVDELEQLRIELPAQMDTVEDLIAKTRGLFGQREAAGFHTAAFATAVDGYATESAAVREMLARMRFGDADGRADAVLAAARATHARVEDLPALAARLVAHVAGLRAMASAADSNLTGARQIAEQLSVRYQSECTKGVDEALAAAAEAIAGVRAAAEETETACAMSSQRFADAETAVSRGDGLVAKATEAIAVPAARKSNLEELTDRLRTRLAAMQTSRADLAAKIAANTGAVAFLETVPDTAALAARLAGLADDVAATRPALYSARGDIDLAEMALLAAHQSVDAVVALFDEAEKRVKEAGAAVADAQSESGRMHAGSRSRDLADQAAAELDATTSASTLEQVIEHADAAIELAKDAVDAAQDARRRHQQNSGFGVGLGTGTALGIGLGGGLGGNNDGGGFGGLGGGGGGGDLGGGSSGFGGGGGDMGGGSSSW